MILNLFAGLSIHLEHVCRVGDWVTGETEGEIAAMSWRAVHLSTWEPLCDLPQQPVSE